MPEDPREEIPDEKWIEWFDSFTRIDDLLETIAEDQKELKEELAGLPTFTKEEMEEIVAATSEEIGQAIAGQLQIPSPTVEVDQIGEIEADLEMDKILKLSGGGANPVVEKGRFEGTQTTYQEVVKWKVGDVWNKDYGLALRIDFSSTNTDKTEYRLRMGSKTMFVDEQFQTPFSIQLPAAQMSDDEEVTLWAKSTDGSPLTVDGVITGVEWSWED